MHWSCGVVVGLYLSFEYSLFLFKQAVDITLDLLVLVVDRLTRCPVNKVIFLANPLVEVLLALTELLNIRILPQKLYLLGGGATRSTRIDYAAYPVRSNNQVYSRLGAPISRLRIVSNHTGEIIPLEDRGVSVIEHEIAHRLVRVRVV